MVGGLRCVVIYMSSVIQIGQVVTALWGSKMDLSYYFGQWLIQQLVVIWNGTMFGDLD